MSFACFFLRGLATLYLEDTSIQLENMTNPTKARVKDLMKLFLLTQLEEEQWEDLTGNQTENKKHCLEEGKKANQVLHEQFLPGAI